MVTSFNGAVIAIDGFDVLVVAVRPWVLADRYEAELFRFAFASRFARPVVLVAQDRRGASYFGLVPIVDKVRALPLEAIPWRQLSYRPPPPQPVPSPPPLRSWMLPVPRRPPPGLNTDADNTIDDFTDDEDTIDADDYTVVDEPSLPTLDLRPGRAPADRQPHSFAR